MPALQNRLLGRDGIIYGPVEAELDQSVFKFYPQFQEESEYLLRAEFHADGAPWIIDVPMVVGEPGSPWAVLGGCAGGLGFFLVVIRAIRIKRQRAACPHGKDARVTQFPQRERSSA